MGPEEPFQLTPVPDFDDPVQASLILTPVPNFEEVVAGEPWPQMAEEEVWSAIDEVPEELVTSLDPSDANLLGQISGPPEYLATVAEGLTLADVLPTHEFLDISNFETALAEVWGCSQELLEFLDRHGFEGLDLERMAPWLRDLSQTLAIIRDIQVAVAEAVSAKMPNKNIVVNGIQLDWGEKSGSTVWDDEELLPQLLQSARKSRRVDAETGEIEAEGTSLLRILQETAKIGYFRANRSENTGLYKYGIDPDQYRTKADGPRRAKVLGEKQV